MQVDLKKQEVEAVTQRNITEFFRPCRQEREVLYASMQASSLSSIFLRLAKLVYLLSLFN